MEHTANLTADLDDLEETDPDMAAVINALAFTHEIKAALLPVMLRYEERRRCRLAKRLQRAQKGALPAEDRKSA